MSNSVRCHYEVLGIARDADNASIKKAHRQLALKLHPDKNLGNDGAAEQFRLVQQAYEVLSDPQERKWYDDHRDAILAGWSAGGGNDDGDAAAGMLFEVVHFMHPGCYSGYHDEKGGFYHVYKGVFEEIVQCEKRQSEVSIELPTDFGTRDTDWSQVLRFYQTWESFVSQLNFAWEDKYNANEDAPNRWVRRRMEEDNKKARRSAKKTYNQDILALVAFVKRRDPRVKAKQQEVEKQKEEQAKKLKEEAAERKRESKKAKEAWKEQAQREMEHLEEADRLAGRVRLADLEDDYDYGGGKKRGKKKKNKRRAQDDDDDEEEVEESESKTEVTVPDVTEEGAGDDDENDQAQENDEGSNNDKVDESITEEENGQEEEQADVKQDASTEEAMELPTDELPEEEFSESSEEEEEPDVWRCECCKKDFKSEGQMTNHMKSKKHKESFKKYQMKMKQQEDEVMAQMLDEVEIG